MLSKHPIERHSTIDIIIKIKKKKQRVNKTSKRQQRQTSKQSSQAIFRLRIGKNEKEKSAFTYSVTSHSSSKHHLIASNHKKIPHSNKRGANSLLQQHTKPTRHSSLRTYRRTIYISIIRLFKKIYCCAFDEKLQVIAIEVATE